MTRETNAVPADGFYQGNIIKGSYFCQGKMPQPVRARYETMEEGPRRTSLLENFDRALSHPDAQDLARLQELVRSLPLIS